MGIDFCKRSNLPMFEMFGHYYLGEIYFLLREYQKSKDHCVKGITICEDESYLPSLLGCFKIDIIRSKVMDNDMDIDLDSLYQIANKIKIKPVKGKAFNSICDILLSTDKQISNAERWIKKAIEANKINGLMFYLAQSYNLYAEVFKRKGDLPKAKENLETSIEIFRECGADGWVKKYEKELAEL